MGFRSGENSTKFNLRCLNCYVKDVRIADERLTGSIEASRDSVQESILWSEEALPDRHWGRSTALLSARTCAKTRKCHN